MTCRISSNAIYRALGVEDIRHRKNGQQAWLSCGGFCRWILCSNIPV